jgi:hypothetical protein
MLQFQGGPVLMLPLWGVEALDETKRAGYWRKRAAEARQTASNTYDRGVQLTMLRMASTYERLASALTERDTRRPILRLVHSVNAGRR